MKVQLKHLPHMVGYYVTEIGRLNLVVHLWAYDDLNQREQLPRRDAGRSRTGQIIPARTGRS